jgi:hypothetical protein
LVLDGGEYKTLDSNSMQTFEEAGVLDGSELQVAPDALAFEDNVDTMRPLVSAHPPAGQSAGNDNEEVRANNFTSAPKLFRCMSFLINVVFSSTMPRRTVRTQILTMNTLLRVVPRPERRLTKAAAVCLVR